MQGMEFLRQVALPALEEPDKGFLDRPGVPKHKLLVDVLDFNGCGQIKAPEQSGLQVDGTLFGPQAEPRPKLATRRAATMTGDAKAKGNSRRLWAPRKQSGMPPRRR